jgi:hypothetical protein
MVMAAITSGLSFGGGNDDAVFFPVLVEVWNCRRLPVVVVGVLRSQNNSRDNQPPT